MFNTNRWLITAVLMGTSLLGTPEASAANPQCFTVASLQGSWALVTDYGANVARAFGQRVIEANGNFTAVFVQNSPTPGSTTGERTISTGTQVGSYSVNCDGIGTVTRVLTSSTGIVTTQIDDVLITAAIVQHGQLIATSIADAVRTPSALVPGGIFVTRIHTRLPDRPGPTQP
jgi:hypothetical protein